MTGVGPFANAGLGVPEAEAFLFHEARLLDEGRYEEWLALFAGDAYYWVPLRRDQERWDEAVSIVFDDRALLETRVRRLTQATAHAAVPLSRTVHVVGNVTLDGADEDRREYIVRSTFVMLEHREGRKTLHGGACRHALRRANDDTLCIGWKRVDLVDADGVLDAITVPF